MEEMLLLYKVSAKDEFGRYFEANFKIDARYLIVVQEANPMYQQMMITLVNSILERMGTEASAEWASEVFDI